MKSSGKTKSLASAAPPRDVMFIARLDGSEQCYMEMLPDGFAPGAAHDLIIALHGHGADRTQFATGNGPEFKAFRDFAGERGMVAVSPDYRASASWMGPAAEADVVQIIDELKGRYKIGKVFMVGASMGGASTLTFASLHPQMLDGITAMNAHANHVEYNMFQDAISASFGGAKAEEPNEYMKRSAEFHPDKLAMPAAFTIGDKDALVPPESVRRLVAKLRRSNQDVLLIDRQEGGHSTNYEDAMTAMEFMFARALQRGDTGAIEARGQSACQVLDKERQRKLDRRCVGKTEMFWAKGGGDGIPGTGNQL